MDKSPLQMKAEKLIKEDDLIEREEDDLERLIKQSGVERGDKEPLLSYFERYTKNQIRKCMGNAMEDMDSTVLSSLKKNRERDRDLGESGVISPAQRSPYNRKAKQRSASKRDYRTPGRSPLKRDIRSGNRKRMKAAGMASPNKHMEGTRSPIREYREGNEFQAEMGGLTQMINNKQGLLSNLARQIGDTRDKFRTLRRMLDDLAYDTGIDIDPIQTLVINLQNIEDGCHNVILGDDGTDVGIYDQLDKVYNEFESQLNKIKLYFDGLISNQLYSEKENYDQEIANVISKNQELSHQNKLLEENYKSDNKWEKKKLLQDVADRDRDISDLNHLLITKNDQMEGLENEVSKLRDLVRISGSGANEENRILQDQVETLQRLLVKKEQSEDSGIKSRREIEDLEIENRQLRYELESSKSGIQSKNTEALRSSQNYQDLRRELNSLNENKLNCEEENNLLRLKLREKENEIIDIQREQRDELDHKDQLKVKQKNEWAEIYSTLKQEIEDLKSDIGILNSENDKLLNQLEIHNKATSLSKHNEKEYVIKLKKREAECTALWSTLKDMYISGSKMFDLRQILDLLALRKLDGKARRKLLIA